MLLDRKFLIFFLCVPLSFCAGAKKMLVPFAQEKNDICIGVRLLSKPDVQKLFNCYNPVKMALLANHYKIIEIMVENKTAQDYVLAQENIDLKIENTLIIKSKIKANPVLIPVFAVVGAIALFTIGLGFAVLPSVVAGSTIGITALNINMQKSNQISTKNIQAKVLDAHPILIPSYSKIYKVIFVAIKNAKDCFGLALETVDSEKKISFDVALDGRSFSA